MSERLVIRGGRVFDGMGSPPVDGDVIVEDGVVAGIGKVGTAPGAEIDAHGLFVTPGFIDIHSHSDYTLLVDPRACSSVYQGVTLEVVGNCGYGCFPIRDPARSQASIYGYTDRLPITWRTADEYFARLAQVEPGVNVISLTPNAQLRLSVMDVPGDIATPEEVREMRRLLEASLDAGAWGFSTGLEYPSEEAATEEEIALLCRSVARADGIYATHTRDRNVAAGAEAGIREAIRAAEASGARLQVSHLLPRTGMDSGVRCMALIDDARAAGVDVEFDQHTRRHGFTYLQVALPPWALDGGPRQSAGRLQDPVQRERMKAYRGLLGDAWERVVLLDNDVWPEYSRVDIATIARERRQEPLDAVHDLLVEAGDGMQDLMVLIRAYNEDQQRAVFIHPNCMPASDATALAPDGPLRNSVFHGAYTWAAWYYRYMVREEGLLTPEEAVRRLTSAPAHRLRLRDRGVLREGAAADIAIFDPERYGDRATIEAPNQLAEGMKHVLVNGVEELRDGKLTGARAGKVLRRAA